MVSWLEASGAVRYPAERNEAGSVVWALDFLPRRHMTGDQPGAAPATNGRGASNSHAIPVKSQAQFDAAGFHDSTSTWQQTRSGRNPQVQV